MSDPRPLADVVAELAAVTAQRDLLRATCPAEAENAQLRAETARLHTLVCDARTYIDPEKHPEWEDAAYAERPLANHVQCGHFAPGTWTAVSVSSALRDRVLAYLLLALLLATFWGVCLSLARRANGENNPTHEWEQGFSDAMPTAWPQPYLTTRATCAAICAQRGLYARWAARDVPCVCSVIP